MSNNQQIFEDWLDGKITEQQCAEQLQHDPIWYSRMQSSRVLQHDASMPVPDAMPQFDSSEFFARQWQRPKVRRSWWPQLSLALSCAAMLISLSPARLQINDGSLTLSWQNTQAEIDTAVNTALTAYQSQQQQWLAQQLDYQQQQHNAQLVVLKDYLQDELKRDQRDDMLQLVEYLNQQRQADWHYWQENYQPVQAAYRPTQSDYFNSSDSGVTQQ